MATGTKNTQVESNVFLRTLTLKTKLRIPPFDDFTVQELIDSKKITYLKLLYYKKTQISFTDDILALLELEKIPKPGINLELAEKIEHSRQNPATFRFGQKNKTAKRLQGFIEYRMLNKTTLRASNQR